MDASFVQRKGLAQAIFAFVYLATIGWFVAARGNATVVAIWPASIAFLALAIAALSTWRLVAGTLFDPYVLFLCSGILFNGGQLLLEVFGLNDAGLLGGDFPEDVLFDTILLVTLAIGALHLGALISVRQGQGAQHAEQPAGGLARSVRVVGGAMLVLALPGKILTTITRLKVVMTLGYGGQYSEQSVFTLGWDSLPRLAGLFFYPSVFFLLIANTNRPVLRRILFVTAIGDGLLAMFLGNRGEAIAILAATLWLWHSNVRRFPKWLLASGVPIVILTLVVVGQVRSLSGSERSSAAFMTNSFTSVSNPNVALLSELGGSMATVSYSLILVPETREFDLGAGYARALRSLIPSLYWKTQESYATWLTRTVAPEVAKAGGGVGFSYVAEAYVNFSWYGLPIVFLVMGSLFMKLVMKRVNSPDMADRALGVLVFLFVLGYPRGEMVGFLNRVVWCALAPYAVARILARTDEHQRVVRERLAQ